MTTFFGVDPNRLPRIVGNVFEDTNLAVTGPSGNFEVHNPAQKGKYKGLYRMKIEVQFPEDSLVGREGLFKIMPLIIFGIPEVRVADHLKREIPSKATYTAIVKRDDEEDAIKTFDTVQEAMAMVEEGWKLFGEEINHTEIRYDRDGFSGTALIPGELDKVIAGLPGELKHILQKWGAQRMSPDPIEQDIIETLTRQVKANE